jgi:phosphoribosylaminoimidazolecarboxamide formyltransferase/IMP cyclohydrolase
MEENGGATLPETRFRLAKKVFKLTHQYDGAISSYLETVDLQ